MTAPSISLFFGNPDNTPGWTQNSCSGHRFCLPGHPAMAAAHRDVGLAVPWSHIDGKLAPRPPGRKHEEMPQGVAAIHHKDGWTAISFWDRTGDRRGASNSTFLFNKHMTWGEAVAQARLDFPQLFDRFNFEVRPLAEEK